MMHGLVLAGGEGSRLRASGITVPKALLSITGEPQIVRMAAACRRVGCATVTCAVRSDLVDLVERATTGLEVHIVGVTTPTSLHTLDIGLRAIEPGNVLCTLVDTIMPNAQWDRAHQAAIIAFETADAIVAVTPFIEDESPLWVDVTSGSMVRRFGQAGERRLVTGGVYWLSPRARAIAAASVAAGVQRIRGFLGALIDQGALVQAVEIPRIVDVDTDADIRSALELVGGVAR
ncbi:MAG TPA: NTP transferase domain-containing protein [Gemmatimonadales bacterium]|jgi:NDP-sugar pyrophosphorylase family protein